MPHGYKHARKTTLSFAEAKDLTLRCLDLFDKELKGFRRDRAVYNFPFNDSTPDLESWLPTVVRAYRTMGGIINPLPTSPDRQAHHRRLRSRQRRSLPRRLGRANSSPSPSGWLIYNTHGLDDEGWGPIGSAYLARLLDRLMAIPTVRIMPSGAVLAEVDAKGGR